jgi:hypothetical protein
MRRLVTIVGMTLGVLSVIHMASEWARDVMRDLSRIEPR